MSKWLILILVLIAVGACGVIYLFSRIRRFRIVRSMIRGKKSRYVLSAVIFSLIIIALFLIDSMDTIIVILHLVVFHLVGDLIEGIAGKCGKKKDDGEESRERPYYTGIAVLIFTAIYLGVGCYQAYHVERTVYDLSTDKKLGQDSLKVVLFADSHVGTTFDGEGFAAQMQAIEKEEPDLVVIAGDFVDDSSKKEDIIRSCRALGELKTRYGVYYVFGNHDKGYANYRNFSGEELAAELEKNNVVVLEDETVLVNDSFYVIGRMDKSERDRKSASELVGGLDRDRYMIMLDHQPGDYENEAASGVDLVLSGHTHGGQLLPITKAGEWLGVNDRTYGYERRNNTDFIVTSGISDWAIRFKTGTRSEYAVINILEK